MALQLYIVPLLVVPVAFLILYVLTYLYNVYQERKSLLKDFEAPDYHWLLGHLNTFPGSNEEGLRWHSETTTQFPRGFLFFIGPMRTSLTLCHPETIKQVTKTAEPKQFGTGGVYRFFLPWIGDGLLLSSGAKWFRNRKLLTPGFHFDVLKPYMDIYNDSVETLIGKFKEESAVINRSMDIFKPVGLCALDVILKCAFSSKEDVQSGKHDSRYVTAVNSMASQMIDRFFKPYLYSDLIYYSTKAGRKFEDNTRYSHHVAENVINNRIHELQNEDISAKLSNKGRYVDFLDILLLARDEEGNGLTKKEIRDEVETFMFEGHDTTTSGISWILYNLARHPLIQTKAREEVDALLNGRENNRLQWEDLNELPYLTRCVKESMRTHPPVPFIGRELSKPLEIDGKLLPAGFQLDINIWNLHHNPVVWTDPDTYDPDRFLSENMARMDPHAFMPFSAGPRNCIGQHFAMNEMKTITARIIHEFEISIDTSKEIRLVPDVILRPESGIHLFFSTRQY